VATAGPAIAIERRLGDERLIVAVNPGVEPVTLGIVVADVARGRLEPVALDDGRATSTGVDFVDARASVTVPARTGVVFELASS
jgi:GMP synthase PP-ATPase subunit